MLSRSQFRVLVALGVVALLLVASDGVLLVLNRGEQAQLSQRQQFIQQTAPLQGLYQEMVKALAELALKGNDRQVLDMLAAQGISVTPKPPVTPSPDPAPARNGK